MLAIKHILLPTDFSDASELALSTALDFARVFGAHLTLMHVSTVPGTVYAEAVPWPVEEMEKAARHALDALQARVSKLHADNETILQVGVGPEWQRILDVAKDGNVDLVVMGTHGRHGLSRLVLGSVAEKIVRLSPVPVLTVRPPTPRS